MFFRTDYEAEWLTSFAGNAFSGAMHERHAEHFDTVLWVDWIIHSKPLRFRVMAGGGALTVKLVHLPLQPLLNALGMRGSRLLRAKAKSTGQNQR